MIDIQRTIFKTVLELQQEEMKCDYFAKEDKIIEFRMLVKTWNDGAIPYAALLGAEGWNLEADPEEVAIIVNGKTYKCAVAHNLGQVRSLLEGDFRNYDVVRLMA